MKIVMFARAPRWYGFGADRLALRLQAEGHELAGIVVETTSTWSSVREWMRKLGPAVFVKKVLDRLGNKSKRIASAARAGTGSEPDETCDAPVFRVASHNSHKCVEIVQSLEPDLVLLRGCGIIKPPILSIPRKGVINPHYALLPAYRGVDVTEWSMLHGDPCAVSVHWVTPGVDDGAVIVSEQIEIAGAQSLGELRERCAVLAGSLFARALEKIESGEAVPTAGTKTPGKQYFYMHPRLYQLAQTRLKAIA